MDDIRDIISGTNSDQTSGDGQQGQQNQYSPYGQQGQYGSQYGQYGQTPDPQADMFPTIPTKQKKKVSLPAIILVIVVLIVLVIGMITLGPAYTAARKFGKALEKGNDVDTISELVFPKDYMKNSGINYDEYSASVEQSLGMVRLMGDVKFKGVTLGKKIKSGDLNDIENYYKFICEASGFKTNVKIEKGYEVEIKFKVGGSKEPYACCVVKMKGEGWKVFPLPVDDLSSIMSIIEMAKDMGLEY